MTKHLDCVIDGCEATIDAETTTDVMAQVEAHAKEAHPDLELDEETVDTIKGHIRDV